MILNVAEPFIFLLTLDELYFVRDLVLLSSRCVEPRRGETEQTESVWKKTGRKINAENQRFELDPRRLGKRLH